MAHYHRDEVLARTDLAQLATDICGAAAGRGRSARWHCPNPDHPDTHPSMTIYHGGRTARWKCHSCGEGGTAIDLWMISQHTSAGDAIAALAERAGTTPTVTAGASPRRAHLPAPPTPAATGQPGPIDPDAFDERVESYAAAAADRLWSAQGDGARQWLHQRGLADPVLRANRVGYDPGPQALRRPKGLPRRGVGIVLPILGPRQHAIWAQTRYLDPASAGRKYDSVTAQIAPNPRLAIIRTPQPPWPALVVVAEGIPDGLAVAHTGAQPVAVVGAALAGSDLAQRLHAAFPTATFLVAFDNDHTGRTTGPRLGAHLAQLGRTVVDLTAPAPHNDLNDWWRADPAGLSAGLARAAQPALYQPHTAALGALQL